MSLGVLNNINAIYAENNLNNTSNSLSKVLQQLSSGSKISSGADDAAGLSLVNGLQANSMSLAQSKTNASEGIGLLTVADGALSQVTNLLNRAVTLATEASNGTLNSSQDTAANQEYQSILSEISNIGSTTTYNNQAVFGTKTNIYTGDSSTISGSIDSLNIRSLSSSNVGDSNGAMAYSAGTDNVFIDLSKGGTNASASDSLGTASQTTTINVSYMTKGANGAAVSANANITVGAGTNYANTAQGLISAVNNSGLGITASFGTAAQAGSAAVAAANAANTSTGANTAGTSNNDTGIILSGTGIGTGSNGAGVVGTLAATSGSTLAGSLSIVGSDGQTHAINLGTANSTDTLANLASTINAADYGVTATVNSGNNKLTFTSASSAVSVSGTGITGTLTVAGTPVTGLSVTSPTTLGSFTVANSADLLTGLLAVAYPDGSGGYLQSQTNLTAGNNNNTVAKLAQYFTTGAGDNEGVTANVTNGGKTITFTATSAGSAYSMAESGLSDAGSFMTFNQGTLGTLAVGGLTDTLSGGTLSGETSGFAPFSLNLTGQTVSSVITSLQSDGIVANYSNGELTFAPFGAAVNPVIVGTGITDTPPSSTTVTNLTLGNTPTTDTANATSLATVTGTLSTGVLDIGSNTVATTANESYNTLTAAINKGNYGVTATMNAADTIMTLTSANSASTEVIAAGTSGATVAAASGTASDYYSLGVTSAIGITDSSTGGGTGNVGMTTDLNGTGGIATISYSDTAGTSLSNSDLSTQNDAEATLTALNKAISDVAAQDGYIGAQINTLNSVSSVLSTQAENVTSAQNAVQATDYASATSDMSKYQILSQTGISALAQANSMQQEVTKLLQ
jgi:flagellin